MSNDKDGRATLPPGYDEEEPYKDDDLSSYPEWWKQNIQEFQDHDLRPYRPPRFANGEPTPKVIDRLESQLDVLIQIRSVNPQTYDEWALYVDGELVTELDRHRVSDGYTKYALTAEGFASKVRQAAASE